MRRHTFGEKRFQSVQDPRLRIAAVLLLIGTIGMILRLFSLMVLQHGFYAALAAGSHSLYEQLFPKRGEIALQDSRTGDAYPVALNKDVFIVYADTRSIVDDKIAEDVAEALASVFQYDDEKKLDVYHRVNKRTDPYEPIEKGVEETVVDDLKKRALPGIGFVRQSERFYPEKSLAAQVIGFVGKQEDGRDIGRYGIEGYWQKELAGEGGFLEAERSVRGSLIPAAGKSFEPAKDGANILLTIDRTIQFQACERLRKGIEEYGASSASLIIMEPKTGAIRAMCSLPDFDLNKYREALDGSVYNNSTIFIPYEPGSIFKPMIAAAALNEEVVVPETPFFDMGSADAGCQKSIHNAADKIYRDQTVTGILQNSINTGMIFLAQKLGKEKMVSYVERFGFGVKEGIHLDSEVTGSIDSLYLNKKDKIDCYAATASFGQGITVTPLQMTAAFGAIANGGVMMRPYVVQEIAYPEGRKEQTSPEKVREVLQRKAASMTAAILVKVIDSGQAKSARVLGYYMAGKTGTAQIPGPGGYTEETNHSFVGFGPVDDPKFVVFIKYEKPDRRFADSTAAPTFADIASFLVQYYHIPPSR